MRFIQIINDKKFTLISMFLFIYLLLNLLDGDRGLISYFKKQKIKDQLLEEKKVLMVKLADINKKNNLLSDNLDLDFLETLYRRKFMFGKPKEKIYNIE